MLDLKALSQKRTFRNSGNKAGAVRGFEILEESGLGTVITTKLNRGATMVSFIVNVHVHFYNLSLSSPDFQVETLCLEFC